MKIRFINNENIINVPATQKEEKAKNVECKKVQNSCSSLLSNYNIAFSGLFGLKKEEPIFADARKTSITLPMMPQKEYLIEQDAVLSLGGAIVDLHSPEYKNKIDTLQNGESFIIGRAGYGGSTLLSYVSKEHIKITKKKNGQITACDLNSKNGSYIRTNLIFLTEQQGPKSLEAGKNYIIPINSYVVIGNTTLDFEKIRKNIEALKDGEFITIGRGQNNSIVINDNSVSQSHLKIEKYGDCMAIKDLHSTNGTRLVGASPTQKAEFEEDYSHIYDKTSLKRGVKTKIPNNSQLYLGNNFTIDVRNQNILKVLEEKGTVKIGRSPYCDIVVPEFYSSVSREHLVLSKVENEIVATDLNSRNATEVIPANKVKAFYNGANNIELSQANIGDCYLLSTIYSLSRNNLGAQILENMVQVDKDGNYIVTFYNRSPIVVRPDELDGQTRKSDKKNSVSGDLGVKAIERAYAKMLLPFSGIGPTMFLNIDNGGYPSNALKDLAGIDSKKHTVRKTDINALFTSLIYSGRDNFIITCTTPNIAKYDKYVDKQGRFIKNHAYSIGSIDINKQTVEIINPHNTKVSNVISWKEFESLFDYIYTAQSC